jgi:DNA (cytosine-5)-methyltransferase 1
MFATLMLTAPWKTRSRVFTLPNHHRHHLSSCSQYKLNPARCYSSASLASSYNHDHLHDANVYDYTLSPHLLTTRVNMSASRPYVVPDDAADEYDSDYELLDFGVLTRWPYTNTSLTSHTLDTGSSEPEIIAVNSRATSPRPSSGGSNRPQSRARKPPNNDSIKPPNASIRRYKLGKGNAIKPGDTVELRDHSKQRDTMHSGDFLRIKTIIMNMETDEVRLRGHRLRRTKYLGQIFDWKVNELAMVLRVDEHDTRSPSVAGMEDVDASEVVCVRECTLTNKNYPFKSFRMDGGAAYPRGMSQEETKLQIFHGGRLTCRVVAMFYLNKNGKPYGGIVRHLYAAESDPVEDADSTSRSGLSHETSISVEDNDEDDCVIVSNKGKRRARSESIEMLETEPIKKRRSPHLTKKDQLIFGDVFCGAGGASQGAKQAGYYVKWGLDGWDRALETYRLNHHTAHTFLQNAHDFEPDGVGKEYLRVDVLHLSPPCCYFSPAQ